MAVKLDRRQVAEQMQRLPEWTLQGDQTRRVSGTVQLGVELADEVG